MLWSGWKISRGNNVWMAPKPPTAQVAQSQENFIVTQFGATPTGLRLKHPAKFPYFFFFFFLALSLKSTCSICSGSSFHSVLINVLNWYL